MDWIPALTTTGGFAALLALALWLGRRVIETRLKSSVEHEFNSKLEDIRTRLRNSEESFKAELRAKENQIAALQSGALTALASRQAALDKRRIEAVDQIWSAVHALAPAKSASVWMSGINYEAAAKEAARNPKAREVFAPFSQSMDQFKDAGALSAKARPHISEIAWALFYAYQVIVMTAVVKTQALKVGLDMPNLWNTDAVKKLIKTALPHQGEFIDKYGMEGSHYLLDEIESRLLTELRRMLQGIESDKVALDQAAAIVKQAQVVMKTIGESQAASGTGAI